MTIKYDQDGNELWNFTYNSSFIDSAKGVATDKYNNVLVTGFKNSEAEKNNYYTIKYAEQNPSIDIEKYTCVDKIPCLQDLEVIDGSPICFEKGIGVRYRSLGNTGADEIYLGVGNLGNGSNRAQKNFGSTNWGSQNSIVFRYDPIEDKLNTTVDIGNDSTIDYTLEYPNVASNVADKTGCNISNLDRMEILVANRDTDTTVNFTNVTFNGNELGNFVGEGASIWHVIGYNFSQGFTLKGNIELSGTFSTSQELSRVEILVGCPGKDCGGYCYDADETTGPYTYVGDEVNWKYVVTNTGDVNLSDVIVNDSVEGTLTLVSGDTNGNGILDTTETWHYNTNGTAIQGQYSNIGNVTATAQYIDGVIINVTDEDKVTTLELTLP